MIELIKLLLGYGPGGIVVIVGFFFLIIVVVVVLKKPIEGFLKRIKKLPGGIEVDPLKEEVIAKKTQSGDIVVDKKLYDSVIDCINRSFDVYLEKIVDDKKESNSKYRDLEIKATAKIIRSLLLKYTTIQVESKSNSSLFELILEKNLSITLRDSFVQIDAASVDLKNVADFIDDKVRETQKECEAAIDRGIQELFGNDQIYKEVKTDLLTTLKEYLNQSITSFVNLQKNDREIYLKNKSSYIEDITARIRTLLRITSE